MDFSTLDAAVGRFPGRWVGFYPTPFQPDGFVAHAETFLEILQQSGAHGVELDFVCHTLGTGTALPGMLAAKLSLGRPVRIRSIAITPTTRTA